MKNIKILFTLSLLLSFLFSSCTKDDQIIETTTDENIEELLKTLPAQEVTVESETLEEINAVMIEYGFEPFTQRDVQQAVSRIWSCRTWRKYGDWNNNSSFSSTDLVLANLYLCNNVGCSGSMNTTNEPSYVKFFGYMSYLLDGSEASILNANDINIARDFILKRIACN